MPEGEFGWQLDGFADASLGLTCQSGRILTLNGMPVYASLVKQRKRVTNSTKAESEATHVLLDQPVLHLLFPKNCVFARRL